MGSMQVAITDRPIAVSFERASQLTSISKNSLRRAAKNGALRTVRFGRRRIIPFSALNDLLRNGLGNENPPSGVL
jgi:excisionase family DNA binding protein